MEEINEILSRLSIQSVDETRTDDAHVIQQWTAASQAACSPMTLKRVEEYLMMFLAGLPRNSITPRAALWEMAGAQDTLVKRSANHDPAHNFGRTVLGA